MTGILSDRSQRLRMAVHIAHKRYSLNGMSACSVLKVQTSERFGGLTAWTLHPYYKKLLLASRLQVLSIISLAARGERHTTAYLAMTYPSDFLSFESFDKNRVVITASTAFSLKHFAHDEWLVWV